MGPDLETFKGNKITMGFFIVMTLLVWLGLGRVAIESDAPAGVRVFFLLVAVGFALLAVWVNSVRVTLHNDGISYHSLFSNKEMRWDALERFEYSALKRSVNFVPIGTYYHFKFVDADGKKLHFGNRVAHCADLAQKVIEQSYPWLYSKIVERFNNDQELDFGAIKVSRVGGIKIKKFWGGYNEIPWANVSSYAIQKGYFYVWPVGVKRTHGPRIRQVPNAFVLLGLLNAVTKPSAPS